MPATRSPAGGTMDRRWLPGRRDGWRCQRMPMRQLLTYGSSANREDLTHPGLSLYLFWRHPQVPFP
jgi:hypothetical protein